MKPRIFLSAVTRELHSARQLGANILTRLGYEPVWQDIFGTEAGDLCQMLRDKIDRCDGLIHLVGFGYGAEPAQPDPECGRVSYTQYEYLHARKAGKKAWILFVDDGFPADVAPEQLDLPAQGHPMPAAYQAERRSLQDAWRQRLRGEGHVHHTAVTAGDLELKFERLKDELHHLRSFRNWQRVVVGLLLVLLLVGGILYAALFRNREEVRIVGENVKKGQESIEKQLANIRPDDIRKQLRDTIEETYQKERREADSLQDWKKRAEAKMRCERERSVSVKSMSFSTRLPRGSSRAKPHRNCASSCASSATKARPKPSNTSTPRSPGYLRKPTSSIDGPCFPFWRRQRSSSTAVN